MDRQHDIELLERELNQPNVPPDIRYKLRQKIYQLKQPTSSKIQDMRQHLIKAHRENNHGEIEDIRAFVERHPDYNR